MAIMGTIIALFLTWNLAFFLGDTWAIYVTCAIAFGMLFSVYMKVSELKEDMNEIKEKLGIHESTKPEEPISDEDIEKELEAYHENDEKKN